MVVIYREEEEGEGLSHERCFNLRVPSMRYGTPLWLACVIFSIIFCENTDGGTRAIIINFNEWATGVEMNNRENVLRQGREMEGGRTQEMQCTRPNEPGLTRRVHQRRAGVSPRSSIKS